jgi:hypothetical protein
VPPTFASVIITLLILLATVLTAAIFVVPLQSSWFWPIAGLLAGTIALALIIPLRPAG